MEYDGRLPKEGINTSPEHPLRELALLLGGFVGLAVAIVAVSALLIDRLVPLLPPDLEARWFGSWVGPGALDEEAADAEDPRTADLQALLDRMASHWDGNPYAFRVSVIDDAAANALALPGGWILITDALLDEVRSENELAMVLGHELGHYHARDHLRGLGRGLAMTFVLGALGSDVAGGLAGLSVQLTARSFDREQEREADAFGLGLVHAEYGHVAAAEDFFQRMAAREEGASDGRLASYLSTHPLSRDRVRALAAAAARAGWRGGGPVRPLDLGAANE